MGDTNKSSNGGEVGKNLSASQLIELCNNNKTITTLKQLTTAGYTYTTRNGIKEFSFFSQIDPANIPKSVSPIFLSMNRKNAASSLYLNLEVTLPIMISVESAKIVKNLEVRVNRSSINLSFGIANTNQETLNSLLLTFIEMLKKFLFLHYSPVSVSL